MNLFHKLQVCQQESSNVLQRKVKVWLFWKFSFLPSLAEINSHVACKQLKYSQGVPGWLSQ